MPPFYSQHIYPRNRNSRRRVAAVAVFSRGLFGLGSAGLEYESCATRRDLVKSERVKGTNALLLIKLAAVSNPDHDDLLEAVVDCIANPPVTDAYSPNTFCASDF